MPGDAFDDQPGDDVAGRGIVPPLLRRRLLQRERDQFTRREVAVAPPLDVAPLQGTDVIGQSAGVLEHPPHSDLPPVVAVRAYQVRQVTLHWRVQSDPALGCELEYDGRGERLCGAADPYALIGPHRPAGPCVGDPAGAGPPAA
jgi:hypothetical protein